MRRQLQDQASALHPAERTARLQRRRDQPLIHKPFVDDHLGPVEGPLDRAPPALFAKGDVAVQLRIKQGCFLAERPLDIRHDRKRLEVELDAFERIARCLHRFGDQHRDRLADAPDSIAGQQATLGARHPVDCLLDLERFDVGEVIG